MKKILSVILAIFMLAAVFPASVFYTVSAADEITVKEIVSGLKYDYIFPFNDGLAIVIKNQKWGYIDKSGKEIIPLEFDKAQNFKDGLAIVVKNQKCGFIDKSGKIVIPCEYEYAESFSEGLAFVSKDVGKDRKFGFIDKTGKEIIPLIYDSGSSFSDGLAAVRTGDYENRKEGYIDKTGKIVIPFEYTMTYPFKEGFALVEKNGKYCGYIDKTGKVIVPLEYSWFCQSFSDGMAVVRKESEYGYVDKTGKLVVPLKYDGAYSFSEGLGVVVKDGKYSYIDKTGKVVISDVCDGFANGFHEGMAGVSNYGGKWGYIDKSGNLVAKLIYDLYSQFSDGLAWVQKDGKIGYIDNTGKTVVPFIYDGMIDDEPMPEDVSFSFNGGLAVILKNGKWAILEIVKTTSKVGTPIGDVLYSDIVAYINGNAIPTSVINKQTLVVVEDLAKYGFDVKWNNSDRSLRVELNKNKKFAPLPVEKDTTNKPGTFKCKYLYTDIKTYLSGEIVESFAIGGKTLINFELLKKYGELKWDNKTKELRLTIETIKPESVLKYNILVEATLEYDDVYGGFNNGLLRVEKDGRYGFIDKTGKVIIPLKFQFALPFSEGLAVINEYIPEKREDNPVWGVIDTSGKIVIPFTTYNRITSFQNGRAIFEDKDKFGLIDKTGKVIVAAIYDGIRVRDDGNWTVMKNGEENKVVDKNGKFIAVDDKKGKPDDTAPDVSEYTHSEPFSEGLALVEKGSKWGFIDKTGKIVVPIIYDYDHDMFTMEIPDSFHDGQAKVKKGDKYGVIDKTGKEIIPIVYDKLIYFTDGNEKIIYNGFVIAVKGNKTGILDYYTGDVIVPLVYDSIGGILGEDSLITIKQNGKYGIIQLNLR